MADEQDQQDRRDGKLPAGGDGFVGNSAAEHTHTRNKLPPARASGARSVYGGNDDKAIVLSTCLARSLKRTISGLHREALIRRVPAAARSAGLSLALQGVLEGACRVSVAKFRDTIAAAAVAAAQDQAAGAPAGDGGPALDDLDLAPLLEELRSLTQSHGALWPYLRSHMTGAQQPDSGRFSRTHDDYMRILRVCEDGTVATALRDAPDGETVEGFLSRVQYGEEGCRLDEDSMWFAKTCLRGESAESDDDDRVSGMQAHVLARKAAQKRRAAIKALSVAAQHVNDVFKDSDGLRAVVLLCPATSGPVEFLAPGASGGRVTPGEKWMPEVRGPYDAPALSSPCSVAYVRLICGCPILKQRHEFR